MGSMQSISLRQGSSPGKLGTYRASLGAVGVKWQVCKLCKVVSVSKDSPSNFPQSADKAPAPYIGILIGFQYPNAVEKLGDMSAQDAVRCGYGIDLM